MRTFKGKTVVITGAASGIGRALALAFVNEESNVVICDWKKDGLEETVRLIELAGKKAKHFVLDVSDRQAVFGLMEGVLKEVGPVDIVINNAGVSLGEELLENVPAEDIEWLMGVNFWGVVNGTQAFLPHLKTRPEASIVNISSIFGITSMGRNAIYSASKFAVRGFTESMRMELTDFPNVTAISVHPGGIDTNIVNYGRHKDENTAKATSDRFKEFARTSPEKAAKVILEGIRKKKGKILIGADARLLNWLAWLFPVRYSAIIRKMEGFWVRKNKG